MCGEPLPVRGAPAPPSPERPRPDGSPWLAAVVSVVLGLALVLRWVSAARSSLWLDETATHYIVSTGWTSLPRRLALHPQMSAGYYVWLKAVRSSALPLELGLRLPSLLAVGVAAVLLFVLARRWFDTPAALAASATFLALPSVAWHAGNARPYALGLACLVAAVLFVVRLCDRGHALDLLGAIAAGAAALWVHYTFAVVLVVAAGYAWERRRADRAAWRSFGLVACGVALLTAPLAVRMTNALRSADALSFAPTPELRDLARALAFPVVLASAAAILRAARRRRGAAPRPAQPATLHLVHAWALLPPVVTFVVATTTSAKIFLGRYHVGMAFGVALLVAVFVQQIDSRVARWIAVLALLPWMAVAAPTSPEDWRGAALAVARSGADADLPILLASGYVEARSARFVKDPAYGDYLRSPLGAYPVGGRRAIVLPDVLETRGADAWRDDVKLIVGREPRFVVLARDAEPVVGWIHAHADGDFSSRALGDFGSVTAVLFERRGPR